MVRIFLVDDNTMIRILLRRLLEKQQGWVVVGEACNGRHAVDTCHHHRPHITLLDLHMPEMDGLQAAHHLVKQHPHIPILLITTDPSMELVRAAKQTGIRGLCSKASSECLIVAVSALLRGELHFHYEQVA